LTRGKEPENGLRLWRFHHEDRRPVPRAIPAPALRARRSAGERVRWSGYMPLSDRVCPRQMTKAWWRRFRKRARRPFGVNWLADFSSQILYICFWARCPCGRPRLPRAISAPHCLSISLASSTFWSAVIRFEAMMKVLMKISFV